ncbi:PQQ-binding-like beta-propeller repeat protein [Methanococcoides seepicolus]|uniref:PQQ-binding-like beta-propeller repeat protein n=2 Tax=Methanococcoides seepicolus TaxID=2828780 RepID=A0A9E4ZHW4_9EURY|nr:PQQ-binding-like beta-propeller repeat protein [Methanococcoides seepicolus]
MLLIPAASASDWDQFQKDKYNNGLTSDKAPITYPVGNGISWENSYTLGGTGSGFDNAPVVIGDMAYVAGDDNKLRALYKTNGTEKWVTPTSGGRILGNMATGNGSIFVPTSDGKIFAIDINTGDVQWSKTESGQMNTPVVYEDHKIYFGSWESKKYYCYHDNGTMCWNRTSTSGDGYYWAGAAIIGDYLVYGDDAGNLTSVYKANGTTKDTLDVSAEFGVTANEIRSSINYVEDLDRIYFTSKGSYIYALGMNPDGTFNTADKAHANIGYSTSTPAVYNGKVYVGSSGYLTCLYANDLTIDWRFSVDGQIQSSPVISTAYDDGDGEIYIYFTDNWGGIGVYCLNETGIEQWSWGESGKTQYTLAGVAISDGWIFFGTDDDYMFGFATVESLRKPIMLNPGDSLQEAIYGAENGDTIMMAPGTYVTSFAAGDSDLYINKSGLTFMADGGEVIISPDPADSSARIRAGREGPTDNTGCDASGITFKGITFGDYYKLADEPSILKPNVCLSDMMFEDCTFISDTNYCLYDNSSVLNCVFAADAGIEVYGNNTLFEGNTGNEGSVWGAVADNQGLIIRNNIISSFGVSIDSEALIEDNVFVDNTNLVCSNTATIIRNNEITNNNNPVSMLNGQVYQNTFTGINAMTGFQLQAGGSYYQNNFIDCSNVQMYSATYNATTPVTYSYGGASYTGYLGNYYSDYAGSDADGDGIGDDAVIDSSNGGTDSYPLMGPWDAATDTIKAAPEAPALGYTVVDKCVYLNWDTPASDEAITSFNVYRATSSGAETLYETVSADTTVFTDHDVTNGQTYYYQVCAVSSVGEGDLSTEITGSPVAEVVSDSWEHFMGDLQHTGYSTSPGPKTNNVLWETANIDAEDGASIAIADDLGLMFVISDGKDSPWASVGYNNLSAISLEDGSVAWDVTFGDGDHGNYNSMDSWATPAYNNGVVFTAGDGARYANNGTLKWGPLPMDTNGGPLVVEGKVIVGNWDGEQYFCFDEETGAELWNISVNGNAQGTPAYNNGHLFLTSYDEVNCVDMDGNVVWTRAIDQTICGSASVQYGNVYITIYDMGYTSDQYVYALDESTGNVVWQATMSDQMMTGTDCTPAVAYGYVYVTAGMDMIDQNTYCFDAFTGETVWVSSEAGSWFTSPVVSDGVVYAGAESFFTGAGGMGSFTRTVALDAFDGSLIWESDVGGSTPALHDGILYTVGFQKVYAFGPGLSLVPEDASVIEGQVTQIQIMASEFPEGLSGYNLTVVIDDPTVAEIVDIEYPAWATMVENSSMPGTSIYLKALDGESNVEAGAKDVLLATLTVSGKEFGSTGLSLTVEGLDDDSGTAIDALPSTGTIEVTMTPLPGKTVSPQDLDGDGLYEDLNGDDAFGFVDVEVFFSNKEWINANLPVECYDFNGNGRIDFDDIVYLFEMV